MAKQLVDIVFDLGKMGLPEKELRKPDSAKNRFLNNNLDARQFGTNALEKLTVGRFDLRVCEVLLPSFFSMNLENDSRHPTSSSSKASAQK